MAFIRAQKLVVDGDGKIKSGSASIIDVAYVKAPKGTAAHSRQTVRERLGRVLYLSENKRIGIFESPTRGVVLYDADKDTFTETTIHDERIVAQVSATEPAVHTVFGDTYAVLEFLKKQGMLTVLGEVFQTKTDFQRLLAHVLHGCLKDGSRIGCDTFIEKSFASYLFSDITSASLKSDTVFFTKMGDDRTRMTFFKAYVSHMRAADPDFGKGCYIDSTPLPNDITGNPFNALCSHGVGSASVQTRLILVVDEKTNLPIWYDIIPGNVLDLSTTLKVTEDVKESLDIEISDYHLDAGYVCKELIEAIHIGTEKTLVGRMPARKGFPVKTLYHNVKSLIHRGKYHFIRSQHTYFGYRKEVELFGVSEYAYVYVDFDNALNGHRQDIRNHAEEYEQMLDRDKDWHAVKYGYFVLVSNREMTPEEMLDEYFKRTSIEMIFKTCKEYLQLLPLSKWSETTIRGKILYDIINTIITLKVRATISKSGFSVSECYGRLQSLMCSKKGNRVLVEMPNKQVKQFFDLLGEQVPSSIELSNWKNSIGL